MLTGRGELIGLEGAHLRAWNEASRINADTARPLGAHVIGIGPHLLALQWGPGQGSASPFSRHATRESDAVWSTFATAVNTLVQNGLPPH